MHRTALLGLLLLPAGLLGQAAAPEVSIKAVKYAGLGDTIRQLRGKVVVVDFWATY